ncbi:hypothetical protein GTA62_18500 [Roseobacter sp. HKCCD9010]|uniref:hypothetical protein n=1 Tax=unclassified Roseobacter TaxID=196798 RepID=UPI00149303EF|nr:MULTISPECIES: hypothetical protein [unclassified Roseobacter]MBF9051910.1 hypothetical protein [Rhodobacterales bacterium HKCCD4356]NNV13903.1 hypothetical protein [Roseobacter sp. HKCCD7357]NNV18075.1 hypothetical protein [Roseobacter sp. HKCCD8768]NNV27535.1 hypothetical protein [Roseobacter sp. HKCCD8192]NNV31801.1 hypothetical protein [Roseobacter sp. HKCCD9061]
MATEWTQILNYLELASIARLESRSLATEVESLATEAQQLHTQIDSYRLMRRNIEQLPEQMLGDVLSPILRLREIGDEVGGLVQSGVQLDEFLRSDLITDPHFERRGLDRIDIATSYTDWNNRWNAALETNLRQSQFSLDAVENEANLIDAVQSRFGSEVGQMQVLQGANLMAASMARQLNDLRTLTATQAEQTAIAWSRVLGDLDRQEAAERLQEREVHETLESLRDAGGGRSLNEIFGIGN